MTKGKGEFVLRMTKIGEIYVFYIILFIGKLLLHLYVTILRSVKILIFMNGVSWDGQNLFSNV